jgi:hypothetical protein
MPSAAISSLPCSPPSVKRNLTCRLKADWSESDHAALWDVAECPLHQIPLEVRYVSSCGALCYRCPYPGCSSSDLAEALGHDDLACVLSRLEVGGVDEAGWVSECPLCHCSLSVYLASEGDEHFTRVRCAGTCDPDSLLEWFDDVDDVDDAETGVDRCASDVSSDANGGSVSNDHCVDCADDLGSEFPLSVFPSPLNAYAYQLTRSIGCPLDFVGASMLATASAALGAAWSLEIKAGYVEQANLWIANVAPPGAAKTPAANLVTAPLKKIGEELFYDWREGTREYNSKLTQHQADKKKHPSPPTKPVLHHSWLDDVTTEALAEKLQSNPYGILIHRDELTSLVGAMDAYRNGKGADRQFYLSGFSRCPVSQVRKGRPDDPVYIPKPYFSILGALPTEQLHRLTDHKTAGDGFLDRFLFAFPPNAAPSMWSESVVDPRLGEEWDRTVRWLWEQRTSGDRAFRFSESGRMAWEANYNRDIQTSRDPSLSASLQNAHSKLRAYAGRLILVLHALRHRDGLSNEISADLVHAAWSLVHYFANTAKRVYGKMNEGDDDMKKAMKRILEKIRQKQWQRFKKREMLNQVRSKKLIPDQRALQAILEALQDAQILEKANIVMEGSKKKVAVWIVRAPGEAFQSAESLEGYLDKCLNYAPSTESTPSTR